jgi:hypothetical protein
MNLRATADIRLIITFYHRNKALRLRYDPYMYIVSSKSLMVVLVKGYIKEGSLRIR